jgi:AAA domain
MTGPPGKEEPGATASAGPTERPAGTTQTDQDQPSAPGRRWGANGKRCSPADPWLARLDRYGLLDPLPTAQTPTPSEAIGEVPSTPSEGNGQVPDSFFVNALRGEADEMARTSAGSRNHRLFVAARNLGELISQSRGLLTEDIVTDTLTDAARAASLLGDHRLAESEIAKTITSGLRTGQASPRTIEAKDWSADVIEVDSAEELSGAGEFGGGQTRENDDQPPVYAARILTRSALKTLPDPEPLINNVLDQGTCALLYGHRGTYKTFIAIDWAASVATGRNWQARRTKQRRVLYVAAEGAFGFKGRIDAWEIGWHTSISDDDFAVLPFPVNLTKRVDVANLAALIDWGGYHFVILDTLARCMVGADENSAKDCGIVIDHLYKLLDHTPGRRGVILGAHHTGKDGKTLRGSSAFEGGADTVYAATRDGGVVTLNCEKRKDGPDNDRHELKLDLIEGTGSAVISVHRGVDKPVRADKLLSTFVHHFSTTGASKAELRKVAELPDVTFYRAVSDLLESGDLINEGTRKRPFYRLGQP